VCRKTGKHGSEWEERVVISPLDPNKVLWKEYGAQDYAIPKDLVNERWQLKGLLESEGVSSYQFTDLGKISVGALREPRCSTKSKNRCCCRSWLRWKAL